jgi:hypothetical protein
VDVQDVSPFTNTICIDVQGVPLPAVLTCRVYPSPSPRVWTRRVYPFPPPVVWTCIVFVLQVISRREIITVRGQSYVSRLPQGISIHYQQCGRAGCVPVHRLQCGRAGVYLTLFTFVKCFLNAGLSGFRSIRYRNYQKCRFRNLSGRNKGTQYGTGLRYRILMASAWIPMSS